MKNSLRIALSAGLIGMYVTVAAAHQDDPPTPPPIDGPLDPSPMPDVDLEVSPERMKENLKRQLDRNARERAMLEEGLAMLERGESPLKVREHLRETVRDGLRDRFQQMRDGRPRPGERRDPPMFDRPGGPPEGGPPPHEPGGPPPRGGPRPLDRLFGVLRETNPGMAERLERLRREDPEQFQKLFDEYAPRLARLAEERERLPDRWPDRVKQLLLQQRAGALAREISGMPADKQAEATVRLRANLGEQFDIRLKFAREDLERNKQHAQRLEQEIAENTSDREAAIEKQLNDMLRQARERK